VVSPGSATAAVPDSERAKAPVPKTGPAPENVPGMVPAMAQDQVRAQRMVQRKAPAAAQEEVTVSGLRDGFPRSHALRSFSPTFALQKKVQYFLSLTDQGTTDSPYFFDQARLRLNGKCL